MITSVRKGLQEPQRRTKSFVGGYVSIQQKRKLTGAAMASGETVTSLLSKWIDGIQVNTEATEQSGGAADAR